ncbi:MAG: hypothetical protein HPM95_10720 [Alphaproteobacteria bacterium]|nr:hypothetical protein [Alphaproteobacteria bacterium]
MRRFPASPSDIHNVHFDELTGAGSTVTNSLFHSSYENIFTVENSSGR